MCESQCAPLEEWMESIIDYRGRTPEKTTAGIPLITAKVIKGGRIETPSEFIAADAYDEWMRRGIPEAGDVVITTEAPLGEVAQLPKGKVALAQRVITLRGKKGLVDNTFLKYLLLSRPFQGDLVARATGTTVVGIKQSVLRKIDLAFPPFQDQRVIAHTLGTLDDKIELNCKTNETLEAMAKALFKSWFVDFDPVRAKAEGRPTGLPDEISDLFPDSFEDSELGEVPSGWEIGRLEEILEIDPQRQLRKGSISPYLEMKGVPTSGHSSVDVIAREFSSGSKFRNGDTLLARITPCLENGKTAFVDFLKDGETGWGSTEFIVMCGRREEVNPFAYYLARSEAFRNNAIQNMVGSSGRQRVPSDAVGGFTLPLPPEEILVQFGLLATDFMRRISANSDQSVILSKIRDTLLPKLISGELRISDAERMLEEVGL
ncbi:restriction endonuclease subunit S [Aphanothece cf. minutissima CCALA 015]|uniref:Restriction endonuclease subunit S n=2 Tax=Aphanothece TaxID=1121 RepID=A0ABX5F8C2_9CHRO|nr:restriction endonuclease subunit S [Aphanothece cf. minutissima CCALA 015]